MLSRGVGTATTAVGHGLLADALERVWTDRSRANPATVAPDLVRQGAHRNGPVLAQRETILEPQYGARLRVRTRFEQRAA